MHDLVVANSHHFSHLKRRVRRCRELAAQYGDLRDALDIAELATEIEAELDAAISRLALAVH